MYQKLKSGIYVELDVYDSANFIDTFYKTDDRPKVAQKHGSIELSLDRDHHYSGHDTLSDVDLLPLLQLLVLEPCLHARFVAISSIGVEGVLTYIHELGILLRIAKCDNKKTKLFIMHMLESVWLNAFPSSDTKVASLRRFVTMKGTRGCNRKLWDELVRDTGVKHLKCVELIPDCR